MSTKREEGLGSEERADAAPLEPPSESGAPAARRAPLRERIAHRAMMALLIATAMLVVGALVWRYTLVHGPVKYVAHGQRAVDPPTPVYAEIEDAFICDFAGGSWEHFRWSDCTSRGSYWICRVADESVIADSR